MAEGGHDNERGSDAIGNESGTCFDSILEEFEKVFSDSGIEGLQTLITEKLDAWKTTPVNIAVVGNSGVGKSSFINAIRDLKGGDDGAAGVGVGETTTTVEHYAYPNHENILLWDLPGVGTPDFTKNGYEEKINALIGTGFNSINEVGSFDVYLILTATRFTENDAWFVENIKHKYKKPYLFVRTKVKGSIEDDKKSCRNPKRDDEILDTISSDIKKKLQEAGFPDEVYLIDNHYPDEFDFKTLQEDIIAKSLEVKFGALVFSISKNTERIIELKHDMLKRRLPLAAVKGIRIPSLENEVAFYKEQLGLTEEALSRSAEILGLDVETLINRFDLNSCKEKTTNEAYFKYHGDIHGVASACLTLGFTLASYINAERNNTILSMMCLLGAGAQEFKSALQFLIQMLIWCVEDAKKIQNAIIKSAAALC